MTGVARRSDGALLCPACGFLIVPARRAVWPWGPGDWALHPECADDVEEAYHEMRRAADERAEDNVR